MTVVDVQFRLQGNTIPVDHGYHLSSAVSEVVPSLHGDQEVGLHPIAGQLVGNRLMAITERSFLTIRISSERISEILPLAGKTLSIDKHALTVGVPRTCALAPSDQLYSRLVVIKGFMEPEPFLDAVQRQLEGLEVKANPSLVDQSHIAEANRDKETGSHSPYLRRTIRIRDKEVVGFAVRVEELTPEASICIQQKGIGGRRRFGCGLFVPDRS